MADTIRTVEFGGGGGGGGGVEGGSGGDVGLTEENTCRASLVSYNIHSPGSKAFQPPINLT